MRYTASTEGVPAYYAAALMPVPAGASPKATTGGLVRVHGYPGNMAIPAPKPGALPPTAAGGWRNNQPSYASPDVMYPSIYYTTPEHMQPPVPIRPDNIMPVPAINLFNMAGVSQRMRRVGGQSQIGQPAVVQSWPQWKGA